MVTLLYKVYLYYSVGLNILRKLVLIKKRIVYNLFKPRNPHTVLVCNSEIFSRYYQLISKLC